MTRERAAELLSEVTVLDDPEMAEAHRVAISALRQQEAVSNRNGLNEPLNLDELRKMDGEPVWIEDVGEYKWHGSGWAIVDQENCLVRKASNGNPAFFERYWKEWVAYRQKPEEDDRDERKENENV